MLLSCCSKNGYNRLSCRQQKMRLDFSKEAQAAHHAMPLKEALGFALNGEGLDKKLLAHRKHSHTYITLDERILSKSFSDPQICASAKRMNVLTSDASWKPKSWSSKKCPMFNLDIGRAKAKIIGQL